MITELACQNSLDKDTWIKLKTDVSGDLGARAKWAQAIADLRPHGIIYMIDGTQTLEALETSVADIFEYVLSRYSAGPRELAALHIFVNFADRWMTTPLVGDRMLTMIREYFATRWKQHEHLQNLRYDVSVTQLSPHKKEWPEIVRALRRFAADLDESGKL